MQYLYSKTNGAFEEHFAADPDTPDELRDEDQEGDEGFEDLSFDEPLEFGAHLQCVFISFDAQVESVGPDGQAGYDHVIKLANRLVELCHQGFVTQEKVDEIVTLWDNPSEHGMGTEYLECRSWSLDILNQLDPVHHEKFLVVLVSELLHPVLSKLQEPVRHGHSTSEFAIQQYASGQAVQRDQGKPPPVGSTAAAVPWPAFAAILSRAVCRPKPAREVAFLSHGFQFRSKIKPTVNIHGRDFLRCILQQIKHNQT